MCEPIVDARCLGHTLRRPSGRRGARLETTQDIHSARLAPPPWRIRLISVPPRYRVCSSPALPEGQHLKFSIRLEGREEECLLVRFCGKAYAYVNRCVHMPRPLDCEQDLVFDRSGRWLRCSMHGIVYAPETGTSLSTMCEGQQLRAVAIVEEDGEIGVADFRVTAVRPPAG